MRKLFFAGFFSLMSLNVLSCGNHLFEIPEDDFVPALQEALFLGSQTAALNLGDSSCKSVTDCTTGYLGNKLVEIMLPDTVKNVLDKIERFTNNPIVSGIIASQRNTKASFDFSVLSDLQNISTNIKTALNRGAEQAAPKSIDAFKGAIFSMSIVDAKGILLSKESAATNYLKTNTYSNLQTAFAPIIKEPLNLLEPNKYWKPLAANYNAFVKVYSNSIKNPLVSMANPPALPYNELTEDLSAYLSEYATGKALDGLFTMVGKKETELRDDPWGTVKAAGSLVSDTVGDLLGDVFSKAKDGTL